MAEVRVISVHTVQSAAPAAPDEPRRRIDLTPWDLELLAVGPIQKGLLFLKPSPQQQKEFLHGNTLIDHLKNSLSQTLNFFPPLAGRFATTKSEDGTAIFFVDCNDAGALLVHAAVDFTVADILEPTYVPPIVRQFFPMNDVLNHEGVSKPLFAVQATELVDGVFIAFTTNHSIADGTSFWQFVNSWSEIARGSDSISNPPAFDPWFPDGTPRPIPIPSIDELLDFQRFVPPEYQKRVFHFSKETIAKLKSKANAEMGTEQISSLQAILAHLWRSSTRCRRVDPNHEAIFVFVIGARQRLRRHMVKGYFGNAIYLCSVRAPAGQLLEKGLGWAAMEMNRTIASQTEEEVVRIYESWVKSPHLIKISAVTNHRLLLGSSPRFDIYGNDFGWGKPLAVRSGGANESDGKLQIFPGLEEGSVDIEACMWPETLPAMGEDADFMEQDTSLI